MKNGKLIILPCLLACGLLVTGWLWTCSSKEQWEVMTSSPRTQKEMVQESFSYSNNRSDERNDLGNNSLDDGKFKAKSAEMQADEKQAFQNGQNKQSDTAEPRRIYSGYSRLKVDSVENEKKAITELAQTNGGYVEGVYEQTISIRVPAQKFDNIFEQILSHGEVLFKRTETVDVTEAFTDLSTRLELAYKTRERLYNLLEKTDKVEERLKILREIKRLTEEIERIRLSLKLLESQIAYSRIVIELYARLSEDLARKDTIPFPWIARLTPLYASLREFKGRAELKLSDDFAVFDKEKFYRAESAEGTRLRMGTIPNKPAGDSEFWQKALHFHLHTYYKQAELLSLGQLEAVLFTSKDREAFSYLVGVWAKDDQLHVVEAFFPSQAALTTRLAGLKEALTNMHIR